jgi:hypothetical protein
LNLLGSFAVFGSGVTIGNSSKIGHYNLYSPDNSLGGDIGGGSVSIGNSTTAGGGLFVANADLTLGNYAKAAGDCSVIGMLHMGIGAKCGAFPPGNDGSDATELVFESFAELQTYDLYININCPTQTLGPLALAAGKNSTVTDNVAGFNLIQIGDVTLGNSST